MTEDNREARCCIVTGANAGIGREIARQLAHQGGRVVMVCRNAEKGQAALDDIRADTGNDTVELVQGDLGSIAGTKAIAADLLTRCARIDALVNNAGVWMSKRELNADGLEMSFMVNHLAPFILTNALLDRLKDSAPARVVNVNAGLYVKGEADLAQVPTGENFHRFKTYMHTKLCNVLFTLDLARRLEGTGVTVNALHPGVIRTGLGDAAGPLGLLLKFAKRFWGTPEAGAAPVVYLATSSDVEGASGRYFNETEEMPLDPKAEDRDLTTQLWSLSEELAGRA